ncbi:hypothetical protein [Alteribacillus sp. HJP-4]|uniref:hypothetical protein n=1 Tax=Alteribacillus sp. HJP-4 TaxID=2775394 RepID=UPI0035CD1598
MSEIKRELQEFAQSATELKAAWNRLPEMQKKQYMKKYPFNEDLSKVVEDIAAWNDEMRHL